MVAALQPVRDNGPNRKVGVRQSSRSTGNIEVAEMERGIGRTRQDDACFVREGGKTIFVEMSSFSRLARKFKNQAYSCFGSGIVVKDVPKSCIVPSAFS